MISGSILKTASAAEAGQWIYDVPEGGDSLLERRVRFELTQEQELRADRPYCPLGQRKQKKVRKGKRRITPETWRRIHQLLQEEDNVAKEVPVKNLNISNENTARKHLDVAASGEPRPESGQTPTRPVSLQDRDSVTFVNNFMKGWGKIMNMDIKTEGSRDENKGGSSSKEPAVKTK